MAGVLLQSSGERIVALQAGLVALHPHGKLVVRILILVERVTGEAGHLAALEAGGGEEAVELAARDPHLAVAPEAALHQRALVLMPRRVQSGAVIVDEWGFGFEVFAGPVTNPFQVPLPLAEVAANGMTLAAGFGRFDMLESGRVEDGRVGWVRAMPLVAARRIEVDTDMLIGRAVARFARDAEFGGAGLHHFRAHILPRLATGRVTIETAGVPNLMGKSNTRVEQKDVVARDPASGFEEIGERKTELHVAGIAGHPISLHVMRAGQHRDPLSRTRRVGLCWRWCGAPDFAISGPLALLDVSPIGIDHVHPELVAAMFEKIALAAQLQSHTIKLAADRSR